MFWRFEPLNHYWFYWTVNVHSGCCFDKSVLWSRLGKHLTQKPAESVQFTKVWKERSPKAPILSFRILTFWDLKCCHFWDGPDRFFDENTMNCWYYGMGPIFSESLGIKDVIPLIRNLNIVFSIMKPLFAFRCHVIVHINKHMVPTLRNVTFKTFEPVQNYVPGRYGPGHLKAYVWAAQFDKNIKNPLSKILVIHHQRLCFVTSRRTGNKHSLVFRW